MENQTQNQNTATPEASVQPVAATEAQPVTTSGSQEQAPAGPQATQNEKVFATIGYVGPLFVLPLVAQPKSEYCKFHAKQSMGLLALFFLQLIILVAIPIVGSLITFVIFAAYVLSMYNAFMGNMWKIPVVGGIFQKIDFDKFLSKASSGIANMNVVKEKAADLSNAVGNAVSSVTNKANEDISKPADAPAEGSPAASEEKK